MPAKVKFKVMQHGNACVVTLPKSYRDYHGVKAKSEVTVLFDSLLLIVPKSLEPLLEQKQALVNELLGQKAEERKHE